MSSPLQSVTVSVPGKVILAGEYDVLQGGTAIAATVSPRMQVTVALAASHPGLSRISSDIWDSDKDFHHDDPISFYGHDDLLVSTVAAAIKTWGLPELDVTVKSGFEVSSGFGSSSAIRLAVLCAAKILSKPESKSESMLDCARLAYSLQKASQTRASGYDIATQLLGGIVEFNCDVHTSSDQWPLRAESYTHKSLSNLNTFVHIFIGGCGAPTRSLMQSTYSWLDESSEVSGDRWKLLAILSQELVQSMKHSIDHPSDLDRVIAATAGVRSFFSSSPAFPLSVASALCEVVGLDQTWSWKATGAGGEDAIMLVGSQADIQAATEALAKQGWLIQDQLFSGEPLQVDLTVDITVDLTVGMNVDNLSENLTHHLN